MGNLILLLALLLPFSACAARTTVTAGAVSGAAPLARVSAAGGDAAADPEQEMRAALKAYETGAWDSTLRICRRVAEEHPGTAWYKRSLFLAEEALIKQDRATEAEAAMLRVQAEYPELGDYAVSILADYDYSRGSYTKAAALYRFLSVRYARSSLVPRAAFRRAQALNEAGAFPEAADAFDRFLADYPRSEFAQAAGMGLAQALAAAGDLTGAARAYREVWVRYPGDSIDRDVEKALAELRAKGIAAPKATPDDLFERGRNLFSSGGYGKAMATFESLLGKFPRSPHRAEALFRAGVAAYYLGKRNEAAEALEKMTAAFPGNERTPEALHWLGKAYSKLGDWDRGVRTFRKVLDRYPDSEWADDALFLTGNIYREEGETKKALRIYRRLTEAYPDSKFSDSAIWWRAWARYSAGDYKKAEQTLQELVDRYPRSFLVSQAYYWQGRASEKQGDLKRAAIYYDRVLKGGRYTYYGYRAAERRGGLRITPDDEDAADGQAFAWSACEDASCLEDPFLVPDEDDGPPAWTEETRRLLSRDPSSRKILELMRLDLKKEAADELWYLQGSLPRKHGALIGLSKAFFELGDYYRSLLIVLGNYEHYLETPSDAMPDDLWRLAYPQGYWESIVSSARKYGQDPYFVAAIIRAESRFHAEAVSPAGARGLMQVMPSTGAWVARAAGLRGFSKAKLFDAATGIDIGTWYIGYLMRRFQGDPLLAAAAYNAGPDPVASWVGANGYGSDRDAFVESIPYSETRGYVKKVMRNYAEYKRIYGKAPEAAPETGAVRPDGAVVRVDAKGALRGISGGTNR
jgi:peptidoglycan lytic transglycosylase